MNAQKLAPQRIRPFTIAEVLAGSRAVRIGYLPPTTRIWPVISTIHLEPAPHLRSPEMPPPVSITADDGHAQEEYEVNKIIGRHTLRGKIYYYVKWKGYSIEQATYEPRANLANAQQLLEAYDAAHPTLTNNPRKRQQEMAGLVQL